MMGWGCAWGSVSSSGRISAPFRIEPAGFAVVCGRDAQAAPGPSVSTTQALVFRSTPEPNPQRFLRGDRHFALSRVRANPMNFLELPENP
jgi:hypothetical protein